MKPYISIYTYYILIYMPTFASVLYTYCMYDVMELADYGSILFNRYYDTSVGKLKIS